MRDHRKLRAFELADGIAVSVYQATREFPKEEVYGLTSQIRRSAVSVPSNIVEGCARESIGDYVRFLDIAFGSLRELRYQLELAHKLSYLPASNFSALEPTLVETEKVLNSLIRSLRDR